MFILVFEPQKWISRKCKSAVERRKRLAFSVTLEYIFIRRDFALDKYDNLLKAYCVCGLQLVRPEKLKLRESMFNFDPAFVVKNCIRGQLLR